MARRRLETVAAARRLGGAYAVRYSGDFQPIKGGREKLTFMVYRTDSRCYNGAVQEVAKTFAGRTRAWGASQAIRNVCHRLGQKVAEVKPLDDGWTLWTTYNAEVLRDGNTGGHEATAGQA